MKLGRRRRAKRAKGKRNGKIQAKEAKEACLFKKKTKKQIGHAINLLMSDFLFYKKMQIYSNIL